MTGGTMDLRPEHEDGYDNLFPQYETVFHLPGTDWKVEAVWDDAYFRAAKTLIEGVARGEYHSALEGVAGLYLFRHYIELALKYIIFHSRWLKDSHTNAADEEIGDIEKTHSLKVLWSIAERECRRIVSKVEWRALDIGFVSSCIDEFNKVDPTGERFRYHGDKFGIEKDPVKRQQIAETLRYDLYIDFQQLVTVIEHVYDVLHYLDVYMIETHGQNDEWQSILDSY
jgi:hypothetical protein